MNNLKRVKQRKWMQTKRDKWNEKQSAYSRHKLEIKSHQESCRKQWNRIADIMNCNINKLQCARNYITKNDTRYHCAFASMYLCFSYNLVWECVGCGWFPNNQRFEWKMNDSLDRTIRIRTKYTVWWNFSATLIHKLPLKCACETFRCNFLWQNEPFNMSKKMRAYIVLQLSNLDFSCKSNWHGTMLRAQKSQRLNKVEIIK